MKAAAIVFRMLAVTLLAVVSYGLGWVYGWDDCDHISKSATIEIGGNHIYMKDKPPIPNVGEIWKLTTDPYGEVPPWPENQTFVLISGVESEWVQAYDIDRRTNSLNTGYPRAHKMDSFQRIFVRVGTTVPPIPKPKKPVLHPKFGDRFTWMPPAPANVPHPPPPVFESREVKNPDGTTWTIKIKVPMPEPPKKKARPEQHIYLPSIQTPEETEEMLRRESEQPHK